MAARFDLPGFAIRVLINAAALGVAAWLIGGIVVDNALSLLLAAVIFGIVNAVVKPVLTILTLPLIIVTLGLFYLVINIAMVALAEWVAPNFSIDGFWSYVGTVVVVWAVNWIGDQIAGDLSKRARPRLI